MSPFDPKKPSTRVEANRDPPRELTTAGGVKVIVGADPPRPSRRRRAQQEAAPQVAIFPPGQSAGERAAFLDALCRRHGPFVDRMLLARGDVLEESTKDLRQEVLVIYCAHVEKTRQLPDNQEGFLCEVIKRVVSNHKQKPRPIAVGVPDSGAAVYDALDAGEAIMIAEERAKLERYVGMLPAEEAEAVRRVDIEGMTLEAAAAALGRPRTKLFRQLERARETLRELAQASARAAEIHARGAAASPPAGFAPKRRE
jgi:DNA-directed RNA polymerase specialized sigma24 family protein